MARHNQSAGRTSGAWVAVGGVGEGDQTMTLETRPTCLKCGFPCNRIGDLVSHPGSGECSYAADLRRQLAVARAELARLRDVVDKLPKTADAASVLNHPDWQKGRYVAERVMLSPHEWTWKDDEQVAMAAALVRCGKLLAEIVPLEKEKP